MANRQVKQTGKNPQGDITALCGPWGRREKADAINDIESGTHRYYVQEQTPPADVHVVRGPSGKYLRADPDKHSKNNLDNLPNC